MSNKGKHIFPVKRAGMLDSKIRRFLQSPKKIIGAYIKEGMSVLDMGCGPGFFTLDMAKMVGESGKVIASDLQEGMLEIVRDKIKGTELENKIILHKCKKDKIAISESVDFALLFHIVHEVPDEKMLFEELASISKPNAKVFIAEPSFHISKAQFEETINKAYKAGFRVIKRPKIFFSKVALLEKI